MFPEFPAHLQINVLQDLPPDFAGAHFGETADGGGPYGLSTENFLRRFALTYNGQSQVFADELDEHYRTVFGKGGGFKFHHLRDNLVYIDMHYDSFDYPEHSQLHVQTRQIVLLSSSAGVAPAGVRTSLTQAMNSVQDFLWVANAPAFPPTGFIQVGAEKMSIFAHDPDDRRLEVVRGVLSTTAAVHALGDEVIKL